MLGDYPITPVLLTTDLAASRRFYHELLGLQIATESDDEIAFKSGDSIFSITKSTVGTKDEQTQATWLVPDVRAEVAELRERGVQVEKYDQPGLKTDDDGVADVGVGWVAFVVDPGKNALAIAQLK